MATPRDDEPTVDAFRAGDEVALADLYARWSPLVYSLALRALGDVTKAEDVTQRVFTRAWVSPETFDPGRNRSDWIIEIAREAIADVEDSAHPESKTGALAEQLLFADTMGHLGSLSQRLLTMVLDQHLTLAQVAERTGLPIDKVRSEVASSLRELRQGLKEEQADAH